MKPVPLRGPGGGRRYKPAARITALVQRLRDTEQEIQDLAGGQIDAVLDPEGGAYLLRDAQEKLKSSEEALRQLAETQTAILNALPAHIALIDAEGFVVKVNEAWRRFGQEHGSTDPNHGIGRNYLELCEQSGGACGSDARRVAQGIRQVMAREISHFELEYPCHGPDEQHWFRVIVTPLSPDRNLGTVIMHIEVTDRRQAEELLRQQFEVQQRLAANLEVEKSRLLESQRVAHVGSWQTDLQNMEVFWTEETYRIFEVSPESFRPSHEAFLGIVHPEDREAVDAAFRSSFEVQGSCSIEHRLCLPDGRIKNVEEKWEVIRDDAGRPIRAVGTCQDITDRHIATERLRRSEELLQIAGKIARLGAWSIELIDQRITWSDVVCAIHDLPPGTAPTFAEAMGYAVPEAREAIQRSFDACLQTGEDFDVEFPIITARGRRCWVRSTGRVECNSQGTPVRVQGAMQDITERKNAAEALKASERQYRLLFQNNPHPMWAYDLETLKFLTVNSAAIRHYGYSREEFLSMTVRDIRAPESRLPLEAIKKEVDHAGQLRRLVKHVRKDGTVIDVEISSDKVVFDGRTARLALVQDVTERLRSATELGRMNRALKMLSSYNEAITHASREDELLHEACRIAVDIGGYLMAWVGYADTEGERRIRPVAESGRSEGYFSEIEFSWDENHPSGQGPSGRVIRTGTCVVCPDIAEDPTFHPWLDQARRRGFRGLICLPLRNEERVFGVLGLYSPTPVHPGPDELKLLGDLADDLAFGIENIRTRSEQRRLQEAVVRVAAAVSASSGTEFFEQLTTKMVETLGARGGFVAEIAPGAEHTAHTIAFVADGVLAENFSYTVADTPFARLMTEESCVITHDPSEAGAGGFPESVSGGRIFIGRRLSDASGRVVGMLFVYFVRLQDELDFIASTLRIFASRAGAELERRQAEEVVRGQAALLDAASDAIFLKDLQGRIRYWNGGAERIYGWSAAEAIGRSEGELLHTEPGDMLQAREQLMRDGSYRGQMQKRTKDGKLLEVQERWTLVRDDSGQPASILSINTDITEQKRLEAQFLRAQRMESIGTLAGGIAHDLNNILAPILLGVDILRQKTTDPGGREMLNTMEGSAKRGAELIRQVLTFARGVEGRRVVLNPLHVLREIQRIIHDTFPKNITFTLQPGRDLWTVTGDPTQLHQVFMNLCVNARDAMPKGGEIRIEVSNAVLDEVYAGMNPGAHAGSFVMVKVVDTGTGMPPEVQEKIFEPFFTTKEPGKGTGLGLSTTLAIVKSHGGFINLYSEPGKGTTFKIYLPAHLATETEQAVSDPAASIPRGKGECILVVDDESSIRQVARETLERHGYQVITASNGAEAVAIYAEHRDEVALVLTDMAMPVMDGPATILALKSMNPSVRIVGSSGMASHNEVAKSIGAGVTHFVPKPYTARTILEAIGRALAEPG